MSTRFRTAAIACSVLLAGTFIDGWGPGGLVFQDAQARVGRPATPGSVAGVARRTTRRSIRRTTVYVATLPTNCAKVDVEGTQLYLCGTTYYQFIDSQYVVVKID